MAFEIYSDIVAPKEAIIIEYDGPNPFSAYKQVDPLLRRLFEGKGTNMYEPVFKWDSSEDPSGFYFITYFEKSLDKYSKFRVQVTGQGKQPKDPSKSGFVRLIITGFVATSVKSSTVTDRAMYPFLLAYMYSFYNGVRRRYLVDLRRRVDELEGALREFLKIPVRA